MRAEGLNSDDNQNNTGSHDRPNTSTSQDKPNISNSREIVTNDLFNNFKHKEEGRFRQNSETSYNRSILGQNYGSFPPKYSLESITETHTTQNNTALHWSY